MDISSYREGWNQAIDRVIELLKKHPMVPPKIFKELETEMRE